MFWKKCIRENVFGATSFYQFWGKLVAPEITPPNHHFNYFNIFQNKIDAFAQSLAVDGAKARELSKIGHELLQDHNFALDSVQPKCSELKTMCQKLDHLLVEKRRMLHKFLDLFEGVQAIGKWCDTSNEHLTRTIIEESCDDVYFQIRQIDYLLSR